MKECATEEHDALLVAEGDDPFRDPPALRAYMDNWDGKPFLDALGLTLEKAVLKIGVGTGRLAGFVLEAGCACFTGIDLSGRAIEQAREN